jgi:hypothetical protein
MVLGKVNWEEVLCSSAFRAVARQREKPRAPRDQQAAEMLAANALRYGFGCLLFVFVFLDPLAFGLSLRKNDFTYRYRLQNTRLLIQAPCTCTSALAPHLPFSDLMRITHARPLNPEALALAFVPFAIV